MPAFLCVLKDILPLIESYQSNAAPGFAPSFLEIIAAGQKPVKEDCKRFAPMNPVNHNQFTL
jgi:hypothetical protein